MSRKSRRSRSVRLEERESHHVAEALRFDMDREFARAIHHATKALELNADNTAALYLFARAAAITGQPEKALERINHLESLLQEVELDDEDKESRSHILLVRTAAFSQMEDLEAAEASANDLVELTPTEHHVFIARAAIRNKRDNFRGALDDLHHAATIKAPDARLHCLLGENYQGMAMNFLNHPHPDCSAEQALEEARRWFHKAMHHFHTSDQLDLTYHGPGPGLTGLLEHSAKFGLNPDGKALP